MAITTNKISESPLPLNLRAPNPETPWHFSPSVFQRLPQSPSEHSSYKKVEIQTSDPDFGFVENYFNHQQPTNRAIKKVWGIHNWAQAGSFEFSISAMEQEATNPVFAPKWGQKSDSLMPLRKETMKRWEQAASSFSPFAIPQENQRKRSYEHAKILPLWHGSDLIFH